MRGRIPKFFIGRYGADALGRVINIAALILLLAAWILGFFIGQPYKFIVYWAGMAVMLYGTFRMLSRNIAKRSAENAAYLRFTARLHNRAVQRRNRRAQKRAYRFFKCPQCHQTLRVPKGRGKIEVHCPKCDRRFIRKS